MKVIPMGDHVLVKPLKEEEVTKSGIFLPETADKEKKMEGEVIAVGPGKTLDNGTISVIAVKVGQNVLFKKWGGDEVEIDGEEYKIISADDILAVVER